jgi:hypothetical protein
VDQVSNQMEVNRFRRWNDRLERASNAAVQAASADLGQFADEVVSEAKRLAPVRTGFLRGSIFARWTGPLKIDIGASAPYAQFVEQGTRPHKITARNKKALAFTASDGTKVVVKSVNHPGTKARPFLQPAYEAVKARRGPNHLGIKLLRGEK